MDMDRSALIINAFSWLPCTLSVPAVPIRLMRLLQTMGATRELMHGFVDIIAVARAEGQLSLTVHERPNGIAIQEWNIIRNWLGGQPQACSCC